MMLGKNLHIPEMEFVPPHNNNVATVIQSGTGVQTWPCSHEGINHNNTPIKDECKLKHAVGGA